MAFDRFKGQAQEAAGRVQSTVGDATGDDSLRAEGVARTIGGQAQDAYGTAKDRLGDAVGGVSDAANEAYRRGSDLAEDGTTAVARSVKNYSLSALLLAASFGFVAALLMQRAV